MPSYWLNMHSDNEDLMNLDQEEWYDSYSLSENFYGLIGGGTSALFDDFPPVFNQITKISDVDFSAVLPLYISSNYYSGRPDGEYDEAVKETQKDILLVKQKFQELYDKLITMPDWQKKIFYSPEGYIPERKYFSDFANDHFVLSREEWEKEKGWVDEDKFCHRDNIDESFGRDIRHVLKYLDLAIKFGAKKFWLVGR